MIRFVFRWLFRVVLLAIVLAIGLLLLKDNIARSYAEQRLRQNTGFDTKVGKLQLNVLEPRLSIDNLVLYNPPEFGGSPFIDAPDIQLEYAPGPLMLRKLHLKFLRLNVRELNIVTSRGRTNITEVLHSVVPTVAATNSGGRRAHYLFTGIDLLNLSIGKIRFLDLDRPKRNQEFNLALQNHLVRDVKTEEDLANIILKLLFRAGIAIYPEDHRPARGARNHQD